MAVLTVLSKNFRSVFGPTQLSIQMVMDPVPRGKVARAWSRFLTTGVITKLRMTEGIVQSLGLPGLQRDRFYSYCSNRVR